jgi:hypothetical protein
LIRASQKEHLVFDVLDDTPDSDICFSDTHDGIISSLDDQETRNHRGTGAKIRIIKRIMMIIPSPIGR